MTEKPPAYGDEPHATRESLATLLLFIDVAGSVADLEMVGAFAREWWANDPWLALVEDRIQRRWRVLTATQEEV